MTRPAGVLAIDPGAVRVQARRASRAIERLIGLVAQPLPEPGAGLWIEPCRAVHTFGVRGALDLVFVSRNGVVLRVCERVPPGCARGALRARAVLEMRAGEVHRLGVRPGVRLRWIDDSERGEP